MKLYGVFSRFGVLCVNFIFISHVTKIGAPPPLTRVTHFGAPPPILNRMTKNGAPPLI